MKLSTLAFATAIWFVVGACALPGGGQEARIAARGDATVHVSNNNWADMVVYASRGGNRARLGTVPAMTVDSFPLPRPFLSNSGVRLIASPIGSRAAFTTEPLTVLPGQTVELRVENHLAVSSVAVW